MERDHVLLAFKGSITSDLLTSVLQIMESKMEDLNDAPKTKRRVFNVLVECLQNLYHHIDETKPWELEKSQDDKLAEVLYNLIEIIRHLAYAISPYLPETSGQVLSKLNIIDSSNDV